MMRYEKPELVVVDTALALVLGLPQGIEDNGVTGELQGDGLVLGLDE